jgi:hypothetical protein
MRVQRRTSRTWINSTETSALCEFQLLDTSAALLHGLTVGPIAVQPQARLRCGLVAKSRKKANNDMNTSYVYDREQTEGI